MRIVFLGSDPIALPLLSWIIAHPAVGGTIVAVYTQPDRPVGRGQQVVANEIKTWAQGHGIPVYQPEKLTDDVRQELAALQPDVSVVMAYGHILRDAFIATPRLGTLNLHASLLPKYRGASPIQTAIANGEVETGVSLMRIVRKLDAGPVADVEHVTIEPLDTALQIEAKLAQACVPLLERNWIALREGRLPFVDQNDGEATFCRRLSKADGALDFNASAESLAARINGLYPWPGCATEINGQVIKIGLAEAAKSANVNADATPGTVITAKDASIDVVTGRGVLKLLRLQRPGGKMLNASDFLRGFPIAEGTLLPSRLMAALVATEPFPYKK
jgi:methionyl-tRNA formyltransferase